MQPFISEKFGGAIWRMEIDELSDILFLEIRDQTDKQVSFAAVELNSGKTLFKDLTTPERWLTGIESAYDGILLLHFYQSENGPIHKGLTAIDAGAQQALWSDHNLTFDYLSVEGPLAWDTRIFPRKLFLVNIRTGATSRVYEPSILPEIRKDIMVPRQEPPDFFSTSIKIFHPFGDSVDYLDYNNYRIVSLHALKSGCLTQSLYIFAGVEEIYADILNADIQKIQPESFILHKNRLIYIKNKFELKVLTLI